MKTHIYSTRDLSYTFGVKHRTLKLMLGTYWKEFEALAEPGFNAVPNHRKPHMLNAAQCWLMVAMLYPERGVDLKVKMAKLMKEAAFPIKHIPPPEAEPEAAAVERPKVVGKVGLSA
ncbi:hypothetical protein LZ24_02817 [Desulfobotulus alkaliphilus]|uniref:Uncharacterized protein n=1 Tax=Desulfobotulus alkaliphilus TaxID=622671 RepID=A0A562RD49_9BACT|nr:hypothetical protein [Desulfobotulus alkaliphilus]TWI66982.1 hypothetical protein LZ24_02817 [Desulfobotulus alkaliphilus]